MKLFSTIAFILVFNVFGFAQNNADSLMNAFTPEKNRPKYLPKKPFNLTQMIVINPDYELKLVITYYLNMSLGAKNTCK